MGNSKEEASPLPPLFFFLNPLQNESHLLLEYNSALDNSYSTNLSLCRISSPYQAHI